MQQNDVHRPISTTNTAPHLRGAAVVELSQLLLQEVREGRREAASLQAIADLEPAILATGLSSDAQKLAFWLNVYNAFHLSHMQALAERKQRPSLFRFFRKEHTVAGRRLSLNHIEHGILRCGRYWWSRGAWRNPFLPQYMRDWQPDHLDPRIHFALNCGAYSCPPIQHYRAEFIDNELEAATASYLATEAQELGGRVLLPGLLRMYLADFGGMPGMAALVAKHRPEWSQEQLKRAHFKRFDHTPIAVTSLIP